MHIDKRQIIMKYLLASAHNDDTIIIIKKKMPPLITKYILTYIHTNKITKIKSYLSNYA